MNPVKPTNPEPYNSRALTVLFGSPPISTARNPQRRGVLRHGFRKMTVFHRFDDFGAFKPAWRRFQCLVHHAVFITPKRSIFERLRRLGSAQGGRKRVGPSEPGE